uniref:Uncharacterized protein MANES_06G047000 n=1 Tax=Rhizophora mucronata TaxID=61149 RepID=A0A2P2INN2_RHIMU
MDSRDSSLPQSTQATAREPSSAEDDAVLSVTAALAKDAAHHFQSRRFPECLEVLNQLKQKKQGDPKVSLHIHYAFTSICSSYLPVLHLLIDSLLRWNGLL